MYGDAYPGDPWTPCSYGSGDCEPDQCPIALDCDEREEPAEKDAD